MLCLSRWLTFCLVVLLVISAAGPSRAADPTELNGDPIDTRTYRAWLGNYRVVARYCAEHGDDFLVVPGFERRLPNSRGLSVAQATDQLTETWRETTGAFSERRMRVPDRVEVEAYARALPGVRTGTYGYLDSVRVVAILGPEEMIVDELWLIDVDAIREEYARDVRRARDNGVRNARDQLDAMYKYRIELRERQEDGRDVFEARHRLVGYPTRGLAEGDRWQGPDDEGVQVAIARWIDPEEEADAVEAEDQADGAEDDEPRSRRGRRSSRDRGPFGNDPYMLLVNPEPLLRRPMEEEAMVRLLDARGYTIAQFVEVMRGMRENVNDRREADLRLTRALLAPMPENSPPMRRDD